MGARLFGVWRTSALVSLSVVACASFFGRVSATENSKVMENEHIFYPEFEHPASQLSAFSLCIDVFIISLKSGEIVRFKPPEPAHFKEWLCRFKVRDIAVNDGMGNARLKK